MANDIAVLESQLKPLAPHFAQALGATMPVERLMRTIMISVERLPKLLECNRQSLFNAAMSAAVLGLEVDGVTGQAFLVPFAGKAQLIIGYKGMATIAARADITVTGTVAREGDVFDYDLGEGWITHKPVLGNKGRIIAAWAKASHLRRPAVVRVLGIDELLAVKAKSPGAKRSDSPWNDPAIGFPAMCEKTAKRRLARDLPLNVMQLAAAMDEATEERGKPAHITPDRTVIIDGEIIAPSETPTMEDLISSRPTPPSHDETRPEPAPGENTELPQGAGSQVPIPAGLEVHDAALATSAKAGWEALTLQWSGVDKADRELLRDRMNKVHAKTARAADKERAS